MVYEIKHISHKLYYLYKLFLEISDFIYQFNINIDFNKPKHWAIIAASVPSIGSHNLETTG